MDVGKETGTGELNLRIMSRHLLILSSCQIKLNTEMTPEEQSCVQQWSFRIIGEEIVTLI